MRIDVQTHHVPETYIKALASRSGYPRFERQGDLWVGFNGPHSTLPMGPAALDLSVKIEEMDAVGIDLALLSINVPAPDLAPDPKEADGLARIANDSIAEAVSRHPDRFRGVGVLGYGEIETSCLEAERCLDELNFVGIMVMAYIGGTRPLDDPPLEEIWKLFAARGVPLVLHPGATPGAEIYADYHLIHMVAWMYAESMAAMRLILSGVMERNPDLKVLLPHAGATLPYLQGRIEALSKRFSDRHRITQPVSHYFDRIHTDCVSSSLPALRLALELMGPERVMFATDAPWIPARVHVDMVDALGLSEKDAEQIWAGTAKGFFNL